MIQARIDELSKLSGAPFTTVLDVDVVTTNKETNEQTFEKRSFVPLEQATDLRTALAEALTGLNHYRDALRARIVSDSAFSASDLGKIDGNGANHAH